MTLADMTLAEMDAAIAAATQKAADAWIEAFRLAAEGHPRRAAEARHRMDRWAGTARKTTWMRDLAVARLARGGA